MAALRALLFCLLAAAGAVQAQGSATGASRHSAAVATEWFRVVLPAIQQTPGQSPPVAARTLAYLGLGLYESIVAGLPGQRSFAGQLVELESLPAAQPDEVLHWPTVANSTLAALTQMLLPNAPPDWKARFEALERNMPVAQPADFDPAQRTPEVIIRSETHGKLLAMALMTWARTDGGHDAIGPRRTRLDAAYVSPSGPGAWVPTPPRFARPLLPNWGDNRPFMPMAQQRCAPPGPPKYDETPGSPFHREADEVRRAGVQPTEEQRRIALYWADDPLKTPTPAGHWAWILTDLLRDRKASLATAAEQYARMNMAMSDAFVATWKVKYQLNLLRPVTYIQLAFDSNWVPPLMETPPFPEYPSGHSVQSGSAAAVLEAFYGRDTAFEDRAHNDRGWGPQRFKSFAAAADQAAASRLYAGIHFRSAIEHGTTMGRCVGAQALALVTRASP
ncbi:vanadium-dependent haloperoxidase [Rhizobacter sp. AJA081-3]|uniref:vanadium-dependent haloperoxidase n=1 Tax=Rhizobacter sp. AJA081-3 TaxID=2753607 RepID=UPI001ADF1033|nr:vanadium-dependent haloperoxidase [Rhizobacter sp. AJA081-3]QTN24779.1 vanadium-dependent haloperoxidase [Rhizobacter sp. AJA081-3]